MHNEQEPLILHIAKLPAVFTISNSLKDNEYENHAFVSDFDQSLSRILYTVNEGWTDQSVVYENFSQFKSAVYYSEICKV